MRFYFLFILVGLTSTTFSQLKDTIFYNENWTELKDGSEAAFYRLYDDTDITGPFKVEDHYITGDLQMEGQFEDKDQTIKTGQFTWYFKDGQKEREAGYKNGKNHGSFKEWYENGQLAEDEVYNNDEEVGESRFWYRDGSLKSLYKWNVKGPTDSVYFWWENGQIELVGTVIDYDVQYIKYDQYYGMSGEQLIANGQGYKMDQYGSYSLEGPIVNGLRHGKWTKRNGTDKIMGQLNFKEGQFIKGYITDNGKKDKFKKWEREPEYAKGGVNGMAKHIQRNLRTMCKGGWRYNTVYVQFIVEKDGSITLGKILKGEYTNCQKEQIDKLLKTMPKWKPGMQAGQYVRIRYTIPIKFSAPQ